MFIVLPVLNTVRQHEEKRMCRETKFWVSYMMFRIDI